MRPKLARAIIIPKLKLGQIKETVRGFKRGMFKDFNEKKTTYQRLKEENEKLKKKIKELETEVR